MKRKAKEKTLAFLIRRKLSFCSFSSRVKKNTSNRQTRKELLLLSKNCLAGVVFSKNVFISGVSSLAVLSYTHRQILLFEASGCRKRAVFYKFFSLEKEHRKKKSKSLLVMTSLSFLQIFFFCSCSRRSSVYPSALSLSLHFEEAFVVVVSEEARFCLHSLFLVFSTRDE